MGDFIEPADLRRPSPPPPPPPPAPRQSERSPPLEYDVVFSVPESDLPEPLPSPETIESSPEIKTLMGRLTVSAGESYVVKYGIELDVAESENMQYVREHTAIRVPKVFAVYQRTNDFGSQVTYIIMERIQGETLETIWSDLGNLEKSDIAQKLRQIFNELRALPHEGLFGSITKGPLLDSMFSSDEPSPSINGPFQSEDDVRDAIIEKYAVDGGERFEQKVKYYRRHFPQVLRGTGSPVFTHGDLQRKNVIVSSDGTITIIDWATSGWYPSFWEYAKAIFACGQWLDDWPDYLAIVLDEYPNQYLWINTLITDIWG